MMQPINVATVFSGIGSFEYVLKKLNISHKTIFACDIDKYVKKSYFANYDIDENRWFDDVCKIDGKVFENKVDLFVGSSPCQSYSIVGNRLGLEDDKGTLFYEFTV